MKNIKIGPALYQMKSSVFTSLRVGINSKASPDYLSVVHSGASRVSKMSVAGLFMEDLSLNRIAFMKGSGYVYFEYLRSNGEIARAICNGNSVQYEKEGLEVLDIFPVIAYHVAFCKERYDGRFAEEIQDTLLSSIGLNTKYTIEQAAYKFCDGFYFGFAKSNPSFDVEENALAIETVKTALEKGALKEIDYLQSKMRPISVGTTKAVRKKPKEDKNRLDEYILGKHILPYDFGDKQMIPSPVSLNDFEAIPAFYSLARKLEFRLGKVMLNLDCGMTGPEAIGRNSVNCLMVGKPGTGKTTLGYALGAALGLPVYSVAATKNTEEDQFQGMTKVIDGKLSFVSTDFLNAYKNGGIIIIEEINLADPAVIMGALGQAIEFPYTLMENGYQPVKRHPMTIVLGTMNVGTQGSRELNEALSNRFPQTYILNDPEEDTFINILRKKGYEKEPCKWVYGAYKKVTDYLKSDSINANDICLRLSIRNCLGALANMEEGEEAKEAIRNTVIGKIAEVDLDLAEDTWQSVVRGMPDL